MATEHPQVDFAHWARVFPMETFQKTSGPRQFDSTKNGSSLDLWKARGSIITSPAHLCEIELVRQHYARTKDLGPAVPVDIFLWSVEPAAKPYLTRLGGVPHRESTRPWPTSSSGKPFTFVAQFCFVDSRDIVSEKLPGEVMLIFLKNAQGIYEEDGIRVEWSSLELKVPMTAEDCPPPEFVVPQLSGQIYRTSEYPESWDVFEQAGHYQSYLFPTSQSTKIGRETYFIQHDIRGEREELICALNSVHPSKGKWPFVGLESLPDDWDQPDEPYEWGKYRMMFADVGCLYFVIDRQGEVSWAWDSY